MEAGNPIDEEGDLELQQLSNEELQDVFDQIKVTNSKIQKENNLFSSYLRRIAFPSARSQEISHDLNNKDNNITKERSITLVVPSIDVNFNSKWEAGIQNSFSGLTQDHKYLIITHELNETRDEITKTKETSEKFLEQLRVS